MLSTWKVVVVLVLGQRDYLNKVLKQCVIETVLLLISEGKYRLRHTRCCCKLTDKLEEQGNKKEFLDTR